MRRRAPYPRRCAGYAARWPDEVWSPNPDLWRPLCSREASVVRPAFSVHEFDEPLEIEGMDGATMRASRILLMIAPLNRSAIALEAISEISVAMVEQPEAREVFESGSADQVVTVLQSIFANYLQDKLS